MGEVAKAIIHAAPSAAEQHTSGIPVEGTFRADESIRAAASQTRDTPAKHAVSVAPTAVSEVSATDRVERVDRVVDKAAGGARVVPASESTSVVAVKEASEPALPQQSRAPRKRALEEASGTAQTVPSKRERAEQSVPPSSSASADLDFGVMLSPSRKPRGQKLTADLNESFAETAQRERVVAPRPPLSVSQMSVKQDAGAEWILSARVKLPPPQTPSFTFADDVKEEIPVVADTIEMHIPIRMHVAEPNIRNAAVGNTRDVRKFRKNLVRFVEAEDRISKSTMVALLPKESERQIQVLLA